MTDSPAFGQYAEIRVPGAVASIESAPSGTCTRTRAATARPRSCPLVRGVRGGARRVVIALSRGRSIHANGSGGTTAQELQKSCKVEWNRLNSGNVEPGGCC